MDALALLNVSRGVEVWEETFQISRYHGGPIRLAKTVLKHRKTTSYTTHQKGAIVGFTPGCLRKSLGQKRLEFTNGEKRDVDATEGAGLRKKF